VPSIVQSIEILSKEKGIDPQIVIDAVKDAMLAAARKHFRGQEELVADIDDATGNLQIYSLKHVVEAVSDPAKEITLQMARKIDENAVLGADIREPKPTEVLGRISAQTAKQVILQKVREAERDSVFSEFQGRQGELVNCIVKRLPKKEQSRIESFSVGDRVRCVIKGVERGGKNSGVVVSRASAELVMRLFEQEVPEIYDNTVAIKACAREAGERTKIAVVSRDRDVDSVGACVGMKGMRVQSIIRELRGEKIDIIEFSEDPILYVTKALSPAKISRVTILDGGDKHMEVVVDDLQLSLAIGKRGQNVRLAAKLIGWKIDIKSEEEKRRELEERMGDMVISGAPVSVLIDYGMTEAIVEKLVGANIGTVEKLGSMTPEELEAIPGIDEEIVGQIQTTVVAYYGQYDEEQAAANAPRPPAAAPETEAVPVTAKEIENAIDKETGAEKPGEIFHNVETGVLEHDHARQEGAHTESADGSVVLDLGTVEGLSGAPSSLRGLSASEPSE
jgi:N utilization substance protein A